MPQNKSKSVRTGLHGMYWWTDSFRKCEVLTFWKRLVLCPLYMLHTAYLCLKGIPIEVNLNYDINLPKEASQ